MQTAHLLWSAVLASVAPTSGRHSGSMMVGSRPNTFTSSHASLPAGGGEVEDEVTTMSTKEEETTVTLTTITTTTTTTTTTQTVETSFTNQMTGDNREMDYIESVKISGATDPFMRSRNVYFAANGLKPDTKHIHKLDSGVPDVFPKLIEITTTSGSSGFSVGENVKVIDGPFNGFTGAIEKVNEDKRKLEVMVKIFGRKTPLELSYMQVEKL